MGLKMEMLLATVFQLNLEYVIRRVQENRETFKTEWHAL
jgi:hypothetical protein